MVFPIVELSHGTIRSDSALCQVSGFFLAIGIEASDVAVAMIAIHSALYIFRGEQGLYPYRKYAYAVFVLLPLMLASLAFINEPAYANSGEYCYLPADRAWSRRAFSWIPRYVILLTIVITYSCIYMYVRLLIRRFGAAEARKRSSLGPLQGYPPAPKNSTSVPPTPPILSHGLIPSNSVSRRNSNDDRIRQSSISTVESTDVELPPPAASPDNPRQHARPARNGEQGVKWKIPNFGFDSPASTYRERLSSEPDLTSPDVAHYSYQRVSTAVGDQPRQSSVPSPTASKATTAPSSSTAASWKFWNRSLSSSTEPSRVTSRSTVSAILRHGSRRSRGSRSARSGSGSFSSAPSLDASQTVKTREKIRRQLRQLIMYPLVYILVWVMPFIVHLTGWDGGRAPYGMILISLVSLCVQGFVNAAVFSMKEKPWKHTRRKGQRLSNRRLWRRPHALEGTNANVGRTREEMLVDGRIARRRMADELAERRQERATNRKTTSEWWDHIEESTEEV